MSETIPVEHHKRDSEELTYYQWVPLILLFMAFLFKFPHIVWRTLNGGSAINLHKIASMAVSTQLSSTEERNKTISHIAFYMDRWLAAHRNYRMNALIRMRQRLSKVLCFLCGKRDGTYLTGLYVAVKFLYLINVIVQFFILNAFMGSWFSLYGFEVIDGLVNDHEWKDSPRFPKVTLCDFDIRQLQNVQRYTVQCVLPINLFNEKIFIFLWFWVCFVAILTAGSFLLWIYRTFIHQSRLTWIKKYLWSINRVKGESDKKLARRFADEYLRDDGCLVLRLVSKNSSDILLADLILELWNIFKSKPASKAVLAEEDYLNQSPS